MFKKSFKHGVYNLKSIQREILKRNGGDKVKKSVKESNKKFYKILACICWGFAPIYIAVYFSLTNGLEIMDLIRLLTIPILAGNGFLMMPAADGLQIIKFLFEFVDFVSGILANYI